MSCDVKKGFTVTQGDDSNALGNTIDIEIETDLDLTGFKAVFQIADIRWKFEDITSKILPIVVSAEQSMQLQPGVEYGALKITDADGKAITVIRDIPIYVKTKVVDND